MTVIFGFLKPLHLQIKCVILSKRNSQISTFLDNFNGKCFRAIYGELGHNIN